MIERISRIAALALGAALVSLTGCGDSPGGGGSQVVDGRATRVTLTGAGLPVGTTALTSADCESGFDQFVSVYTVDLTTNQVGYSECHLNSTGSVQNGTFTVEGNDLASIKQALSAIETTSPNSQSGTVDDGGAGTLDVTSGGSVARYFDSNSTNVPSGSQWATGIYNAIDVIDKIVDAHLPVSVSADGGAVDAGSDADAGS